MRRIRQQVAASSSSLLHPTTDTAVSTSKPAMSFAVMSVKIASWAAARQTESGRSGELSRGAIKVRRSYQSAFSKRAYTDGNAQVVPPRSGDVNAPCDDLESGGDSS